MKKDPRTIIDIEQDPGLHHRPVVQEIKKPKVPFIIPRFHLNRDKPDSRDYKYQITNIAQQNSVDLRIYCSLIENQGNLGSCTGQAIAGAIEMLNKRNRKTTDISRLFIYYYERVLLGTVNYDSGAYIRDGIKVTNKQGAPLESFWPYDITKFKLKPSTNSINDAARRKVTLYERVDDHNGVLDALNNGFPVIIGFSVYSSFMSNTVARTGVMPYPNISTEKLLGGHAVLLVGYDKSRGVYIARNSWGTSWGENGYFYMPFAVIQNPSMSFDFWVIKSVNNP